MHSEARHAARVIANQAGNVVILQVWEGNEVMVELHPDDIGALIELLHDRQHQAIAIRESMVEAA